MMPCEIKVLGMLQRSGKKGTTFNDYHVGFRLGAVIFKLRERGFDIRTMKEPKHNGGWYARYVLIKDRK